MRFTFLFFAVIWIGAVPKAAGAAVSGAPPAKVKEAIEWLTDPGMMSENDRLKKVVPLGDAAVPWLVQACDKAGEGDGGMIAVALCRINTPLSRESARNIILENKSRLGASSVMENYPAEFDLELAPVLIQTLRGESLAGWAGEGLVRMIERRPPLAALVVAALDDGEKDRRYGMRLGEVLERVSATGSGSPRAGQDYMAHHNAFWRQWWARHKDQNGFEWLIEPAASSDPDSRANALQRMGYLHVEEARPYFQAALKSTVVEDRYWGAAGLSELNGWPHMTERATEESMKAYADAVLQRMMGAK
ncbi:hypothetical protein BH09VER1_BH09VER1_10890 [soil metagenome]